MLTVRHIDDHNWELKETILGFFDAKVTFWYFNFNSKKLSECSDYPNDSRTRVMDSEQISRYKGYIARLPKHRMI